MIMWFTCVWTYTRQLIIIAGGEPALCCGISMLSERVGSMHAHMHYVCKSLVQNAGARVVLYVEKYENGLCEVTGEKN